jgi:hypothetical protein
MHSHNLLLPALGLPADLANLRHVPINLLHTVMGVGVRSSGSPLIWLGHSPLLNALELILAALGVYFYIYQERSLRSVSLASAGVISLGLASLGGNVGFACIVPIAYLIIGGGLSHFLSEWLNVFPRNPIARGFGVAVICIMLFFSVFYQVRSYYIAWPHNAATRQTFHISSS